MTSTEHRPLTVVLFHSMFGLRPVELAAAHRLRAAGHHVVTPDLYAGAVAGGGGTPTVEDGFALMATVSWEAIVDRAQAAVRGLPASSVLCGVSMGAGVVGAIWPERLDAAAVILLHAATTVPRGASPGTPAQVHIAADDPIAPTGHLDDFRDSAARADALAVIYTYPGAGHFFTDPDLPDYDAGAADQTWRRVESLLATIR